MTMIGVPHDWASEAAGQCDDNFWTLTHLYYISINFSVIVLSVLMVEHELWYNGMLCYNISLDDTPNSPLSL